MYLEKKYPYLQYRNGQLNITVMEETKNVKLNYRVTIIMKDEVVKTKFSHKLVAMDSITTMKKLYPDLFIGGALEEKGKKWELIWTLGNN